MLTSYYQGLRSELLAVHRRLTGAEDRLRDALEEHYIGHTFRATGDVCVYSEPEQGRSVRLEGEEVIVAGIEFRTDNGAAGLLQAQDKKAVLLNRKPCIIFEALVQQNF